MNKQELIEMLRSKIEYANDIQNTTFDIFVSVATDLLRELEGDQETTVDPKTLETIMIGIVASNMGYVNISMVVSAGKEAFAQIGKLSCADLKNIKAYLKNLPQPPKTEK